MKCPRVVLFCLLCLVLAVLLLAGPRVFGQAPPATPPPLRPLTAKETLNPATVAVVTASGDLAVPVDTPDQDGDGVAPGDEIGLIPKGTLVVVEYAVTSYTGTAGKAADVVPPGPFIERAVGWWVYGQPGGYVTLSRRDGWAEWKPAWVDCYTIPATTIRRIVQVPLPPAEPVKPTATPDPVK